MISINNQNNRQNEIALSTKDRAFVDYVHNTITLYGEIPYSIPERAIVDTILKSARFFFEYYDNAWIESFYILRKKDIIQHLTIPNLSGFNQISVILPENIRIVRGLSRFTGGLGVSESDFYQPLAGGIDSQGLLSGTSSALSANLGSNFGTMGLAGINNNLYLLENVVKMVENAALSSVFKKGIPFRFNNEAHQLIIKQTVKEDLILNVYRDIEIHHLYNNTFFERHVLANCKKILKRKIGGHTIELPNGATLNVDEICDNLEDAENVENIIRASGGVGDIIVKRNK